MVQRLHTVQGGNQLFACLQNGITASWPEGAGIQKQYPSFPVADCLMGVAIDNAIRFWKKGPQAVFDIHTHVRTMGKVAVIGKTVADELFPNEDPLGKTLRIRNIPFKIVGVLESKGFNLFGQDQDDIVVIPYTSHMRRIARRPSIGSILVQARSAAELDTVQQQVTDLLTHRRKGREPDFTVRNQVEFAQMATSTSKTMTVLLLITSVVSLIVGGIGIMNIMLVSVTERTREIGTRLAVGAHGRDVLLQFLIEAMVVSVLGGAIGIGTGIVASKLITTFVGWPVLIPPVWIAIAFGISALIGVFFGYYPARKAAQLDPIEALRFE